MLAMQQIALQARADVLVEPACQPFWTIAPYALSHHDLHLAEGQAFQPTFDLSSGTGNLREWRLDRKAHTSAGWDARSVLLADEKADPDWWINRKIIMRDASGNQQGFWWNHLARRQKELLDARNVLQNGAGDSPLLNYLRGDRSGEVPGGYRVRESLLGSMIHANPLFVGAPAETHADYPLFLPDYARYSRNNAGRDGRVYIGANDGMLHAFDASNGREVWAYVPAMIDYAKLAGLPRMPFAHACFLDGKLVAADAMAGGRWRTLLSGGLGAGGKGFFILDVTSPDLEDVSTDRKILAEFDGSDPDLGYIHGPVSIVLLEDDAWYLVTGNGFLPESGNASLYLVPLEDISNMSPVRIRVPEMRTLGLAPPAIIDLDGNGKADTAYAGDLEGNIWKFDLAGRSAESYPLYDAGEKQPVTTRPEVAAHPDGGFMVYFGTGSLLSQDDAANTDRQSLYGIHDYPGRSRTVVESDLMPAVDLALEEVHAHDKRLRVGGLHARMNLRKGWKVDLPETGERVLEAPRLRAGRLQFISTYAEAIDGIPVPASWYMELDWLSGGSPDRPISDHNDDGNLTDEDKVSHEGVMVPAVGEYLGAGYFSQVRLAHTASGSDVAFINGLAVSHAVDEVPGGRHFDLDTDDVDRDGLGGQTGQHTHAFDESEPAAREIDYFGTRLALSGHRTLDLPLAAHLADDELFILTLANADLSPGAVITLQFGGVERQWNVLDYQKLVQDRLQSYDGTSDLLDHFVDDHGYPLVYAKPGGSLAGSVLESLKITIRDDAWSRGELLGTRPECVSTDPHAATPHRWRGGALTLHAIRGKSLKSVNWRNGEKPWTSQNPRDLHTSAEGLGGVHANPDNPDGFLYESTIFWHHPADECYGEPGWGLAAMHATGAVTESMVISMLFDMQNVSEVSRIMQAIALISALVCDQGSGFVCAGAPAYLEGREYIDDYLDFQSMEDVALLHEGILEIDEAYRLHELEAVDDLARVIGPKAPPVIDGLDQRRSWIDVEF
jgi:outer membrane protein assembly factor BamB